MIAAWSIAHTAGVGLGVEGGYNLQALGDSVVACLEVLLDKATDGSPRVDNEADRG